MRIVLGLEYCGVGFCGWQSQLQGCGVQDALEAAVSVIAGENTSVIAAGRTDTGVHAALQVVHFDTAVEPPADRLGARRQQPSAGGRGGVVGARSGR